MKSLSSSPICILGLLVCCVDVYCQGHATPQGDEQAVLFPFRSAANGRIGYVDAQGAIKVPPALKDCGGVDPGPEFTEGRAVTGCIPLGYVDATAKTVIPPKFDDAKPFSQGLAAVRESNAKWGYINKQGALVIGAKFQDAQSFSEGLAAVANEDGAWGFVDASGRMEIPFGFENAGAFSHGLAPIEVNGKFGYTDKTGTVVIAAQYNDARAFSQGLAAVLGDSWQYIGRDGKPAFASAFDQAGDFSEGLAPVRLKGQKTFGYISDSGTMRLQPQFERAFPFKNGLALVYFGVQVDPNGQNRRRLLYGYIDKTGRRVFSAELPYVQSDGSRSLGSPGQAYIPMAAVTIESAPAGAKVYLVPLDDWESDKNLANDKDKFLRYLLSEYTPLHDYEVIQQVYRVVFDLGGRRVVRQFDVNERSSKRLEIDLQKEQQ